MKLVQIVGLLITLLAIAYYASFADRLNSVEEQGSINLGIGLIFVFILVFISAVLIIPSTFMLWRKKTREYFGFNGRFWHSVLVTNSTLAIVYSAFALWFAVSFVVVWASS